MSESGEPNEVALELERVRKAHSEMEQSWVEACHVAAAALAECATAKAKADHLESERAALYAKWTGATVEVEKLQLALLDMTRDRDIWRLRWLKAQEQVGRWFKAAFV